LYVFPNGEKKHHSILNVKKQFSEIIEKITVKNVNEDVNLDDFDDIADEEVLLENAFGHWYDFNDSRVTHVIPSFLFILFIFFFLKIFFLFREITNSFHGNANTAYILLYKKFEKNENKEEIKHTLSQVENKLNINSILSSHNSIYSLPPHLRSYLELKIISAALNGEIEILRSFLFTYTLVRV
jgi:multidrug efflux pump subunit AcrB